MNPQPPETLHHDRRVRSNRSDTTVINKPVSRSFYRIFIINSVAVTLTVAMFYFQLVIIFDVAGEFIYHKPWLIENMGPKNAGKIFVLGCFLAMMLMHLTQAAVWGLFLRYYGFFPTIADGMYFSASSITTLGYGDILLKFPWRHIGTLIAITGVLMFGCSTAFLFLILQEFWLHL